MANSKYRLILQVFEEEPFFLPKEYIVETIFYVKPSKSVLNQKLKDNFKEILKRCNLEEKTDE